MPRWRLSAPSLRMATAHHSRERLLALLFFAGLETIFAIHVLIVPLIILLVALLAYGVWLVRAEEGQRFQPSQTVLPVLAATGLTGFGLFLPRTSYLHLYFLLASLVLYWLLRHGSRQAYPTWNWTIATVIYFVNLGIILGLRFHLYLPLLLTLMLVVAVTFLISYQSLRRVVPGPLPTVAISLSTALLLGEVAWVLQFLPLPFLAQAGMLVALYYVGFHLLSISYERALAWRDVREYVVLGVIAVVILLASLTPT